MAMGIGRGGHGPDFQTWYFGRLNGATFWSYFFRCPSPPWIFFCRRPWPWSV